LQKKELEKDSFNERKTKKTTDSESEKSDKKWFHIDFVRQSKKRIDEKKTRLKEQLNSLKKTSPLDKLDLSGLKKPKVKVEDIPLNRPEQKTLLDRFQLKDLQKLSEKLNLDNNHSKEQFPTNSESKKFPVEKPKNQGKRDFKETVNKWEKRFSEFNRPEEKKKKQEKSPLKIATIRDKWEEKRTRKQEELKQQMGLQKLADKLNELKSFDSFPGMEKEQKVDFPEFKIPEISDLGKELSFEDRKKKLTENLEAKSAEKKDEDRRERLKEDARMKKKSEKEREERAQKNKERKKEKYT
jgi:hypothetical protein